MSIRTFGLCSTAAIVAAAVFPSTAIAAGSYDMRAMMASPYPLYIKPMASMYAVPGSIAASSAGTAGAPAAAGTADTRTPPPVAETAIDPYTPVTAWRRGVPPPREDAAVAMPAQKSEATGFGWWGLFGDNGETASAPPDAGRDDGGVWRLEFLNEDRGPLEGLLGKSETGHLTWGWRMSYTPDAPNPDWFQSVRGWLGWPGPSWTARVSYGVEQAGYVPNSIRRDNDEIDRPYAGILLFGTQINLSKPFDGPFQQNDFLDLGVGLAGEASLAEAMHRGLHSLTGARKRGWRGQIQSEPILQTYYEKGLRAVVGWPNWFETELYPYAGIAAGNLFTYGATGLTVRVGTHLKEDAGPPRSRMLLGGETFVQHGNFWSWNLFAGAQQKAVAWNMTTDGNTYRDTSDVTTKPFTSEFIIGAEVGYGAYRATLTHVYRTEEFEEQVGQDRFVRAALSAHF